MTPIIVIAGLVGLVWALVLFRYGDLVAGCLAVLLVGSVFGHAFFHVSVVTADRLLIAGLMVAYVVYRRFGWADPKPLDKADIALFLFFGVLTFSTLSHEWQLDGSQPLATLLFFFLMPAAVYWVGRQAKLTEHSVLMLCGGMSVFAIYLALTAFAETTQTWAFVFPKYITSPAEAEFLGRGRGPFLNPIGCGLYMSAGLFGVVQWWPRLGRIGRAGLLFVAGVILLGIYCTLTRSVWLGAGLGIVLMIGLAIDRRWRVPLAVALILAAGVVVAVKRDDLNAFKRDKHVSVHDMSRSASLRPVLAAVAWKMFLDRPFLGCGFGQYKEVDRDYLQETVGELSLQRARPYGQHNVFLALLTQTGLAGAGLWVVALGLWSRNAWLLWSNQQAPIWARQHALVMLAILVAYTCNGMFHDVGIITMVNALLFLVAGVGQGLAPHSDRARKPADTTLFQEARVVSATGT
jgi:O-antigen ligase